MGPVSERILAFRYQNSFKHLKNRSPKEDGTWIGNDPCLLGVERRKQRIKEENGMAPLFTKDGTGVEARTAVVGVGGAGCNVVSDIFWDLPSVDTIAINTDKDALLKTDADKKLFICKAVTQGEGAKGDSMVGKTCAQAHIEEIEEALSAYDVVYVVAGLGGGTGTGAAPVIAEIAQRHSIVFSILINPFSFESARSRIAKEGLMHMKSVCPMTTVVENDLVLSKMSDMTLEAAFETVNMSIAQYIAKQQKKVLSSFVEQIRQIGEFVKEDCAVIENHTSAGLVTN